MPAPYGLLTVAAQVFESGDGEAQLNVERAQAQPQHARSGAPSQPPAHADSPAAANRSADLSSSPAQQQEQQEQQEEQEEQEQEQRQQPVKQPKQPKQQRCAIYNGVRFHLDVTAGLAWAFQVRADACGMHSRMQHQWQT